jgi:hypothetical protein
VDLIGAPGDSILERAAERARHEFNDFSIVRGLRYLCCGFMHGKDVGQ